MLTWIRTAVIDISLAECAGEPTGATAGIAVHSIHAYSAILTDYSHAVVYISSTCYTAIPRHTFTCEAIDSINTCSTILTRAVAAVINIRLTHVAFKSRRAQTPKTSYIVNARAAIFAWTDCLTLTFHYAFIDIRFTEVSGEARHTMAGKAINPIDTSGIVCTGTPFTFINFNVTDTACETTVTHALVPVDQVYASSILARRGGTFVNIIFTHTSSVARHTVAGESILQVTTISSILTGIQGAVINVCFTPISSVSCSAHTGVAGYTIDTCCSILTER